MNICNNTITKNLTTRHMCRYTTLWIISVLKAATKNKTTFVTTHFKRLTTCVSQSLYKVTVTSRSFYVKRCPPCSLAAGRHTKPATPLINGAINQTLRQFAPLSDDSLLQLVNCRESSTLIHHLLKSPKQHNRLVLSPGCLKATCQVRSTLITQLVSGAAWVRHLTFNR